VVGSLPVLAATIKAEASPTLACRLSDLYRRRVAATHGFCRAPIRQARDRGFGGESGECDRANYMPALDAIRLNPQFKAKYEAMTGGFPDRGLFASGRRRPLEHQASTESRRGS
jgi:hypothetical protein